MLSFASRSDAIAGADALVSRLVYYFLGGLFLHASMGISNDIFYGDVKPKSPAEWFDPVAHRLFEPTDLTDPVIDDLGEDADTLQKYAEYTYDE